MGLPSHETSHVRSLHQAVSDADPAAVTTEGPTRLRAYAGGRSSYGMIEAAVSSGLLPR
jgi:hypothetical protein